VVTELKSSTRSGSGPTDAALVVAARAGEGWAQEALYQRYARMVIGLSQRILAGRDDADDLAQDAFVYAFTRLDSLQNPQAFQAWLRSIVARTASKRLRRQRLLVRLGIRRNEPIDPDTVVAPSTPPDLASEIRGVYGLLDRLPAEERVALVLRRVEGLDLGEIAEQMKLSLATVKRRIAAAEGRLERAKARG
jgi:RNA polymerase sigma-70 factor (ECF subfamily)